MIRDLDCARPITGRALLLRPFFSFLSFLIPLNLVAGCAVSLVRSQILGSVTYPHGGPAVLESSIFGVAPTVHWEMGLGLGFGVSRFALRSGALRLGFGVLGSWSLGFWGLEFRVLEFRVLGFRV